MNDRLDTLLRSCVECGLCLPHCATYLTTGNETLSPRGRLLLLGEVLAGRLPADDASVREAFDLCLGCMACTSACPSGVDFDLIEYLQELGSRTPGWAGPVPVSTLDRGSVLRPLRQTAQVARATLQRTLGPFWRQRLDTAPRPLARLARQLGSLPVAPEDDRRLGALLDELAGGRRAPVASVPSSSVPSSASGCQVAWFRGCADASLLPGTARRLRRLLEGLGCRITEPEGQECCGALATHTGGRERAERLHQHNLEAFTAALAACDHLVVAAAGCGRELQRYPAPLAAKVIDAVVLLDRLAPTGLAAVPLRVALHDPCHARHGQQILAEPRRLLRRIPGLELLEPPEAEVCCGAAGVYGLRHLDLSAAMGRRKAGILAATGCDLVVTTNPGCLGQIADGLALVAPEVPVLPLSDLVWYAWHRTREEKP
jgi:glycolate oxidase iron-sulfur subunit